VFYTITQIAVQRQARRTLKISTAGVRKAWERAARVKKGRSEQFQNICWSLVVVGMGERRK
jgi:hypothetical protein